MHKHSWKEFNDILVCTACGVTKTPAGIIFDRKLPERLKKRGKNEKKRRGLSKFLCRTG